MSAIITLILMVFPLNKVPVSSLVVPGIYQVENGKRRGYGYMALEVVLFGYYFYSEKKMDAIKSTYVEFAKENATSRLITDPTILSLLEKYRTFNDYYEMLYRDARQIYPDNPEKQDEYVKRHLRTDIMWSWNSQNAWYAYQDMRRSYREIAANSVVILGFVLTNHLASFIDAIITNRLLKNKVEIKTTIGPLKQGLSLKVRF